MFIEKGDPVTTWHFWGVRHLPATKIQNSTTVKKNITKMQNQNLSHKPAINQP